jgi:hypothetical protein
LALRVQVDQQHLFFSQSKTVRQGDSSGGFTHPTLLIGNTDDFGWHGVFP